MFFSSSCRFIILWIITPKPLKIQNFFGRVTFQAVPPLGKLSKFQCRDGKGYKFSDVVVFCADESSIFINICFTRVKILKISLRIDSYLVLKILMTFSFFFEFNVTFQAKIEGLGL